MAESLAKEFGKQLRLIRKEKGWSQEELSYKVKLHRTYIGAVERGEKNLTLKNIQKISECLGTKISDVFLAIGL